MLAQLERTLGVQARRTWCQNELTLSEFTFMSAKCWVSLSKPINITYKKKNNETNVYFTNKMEPCEKKVPFQNKC